MLLVFTLHQERAEDGLKALRLLGFTNNVSLENATDEFVDLQVNFEDTQDPDVAQIAMTVCQAKEILQL